MSTFNARSATEALFPWSLIWISEDTAANLSKIVRLNALHSFPTSIEWNRRKARNSIDWNLLEQTDCNSVHQDSIEWNSWCEDPTSIDWNRRKARKRSNLLEHAQLGRLKRWKLKRLKSLEVQIENSSIKF